MADNQAQQKAPRKFHPQVSAFDEHWFGVPTFFTDKLMRLGKGIPNSFWKLTFVVWRDVLKPKKNAQGEYFHDYIAKTTFEQLWEEHRIGDKAVTSWQAAYSVSGVFAVKNGKRHNKKVAGTPTAWRYNVGATDKDWQAFIVALSTVVSPSLGDKRMARHGKTDDGLSASPAFQLALALAVDAARARANGIAGPALAPVNTNRIENFLANGIGKRNDDGSIDYWYKKPSHAGLQR